MKLGGIDWAIIGAFFVVSLGIGVWASKSAGKSSSEFFLGGRSMPWWLLGVSMVATTFSTDTPNLVADLVRNSGVAGNWGWWAFLLSGMLTVFVFVNFTITSVHCAVFGEKELFPCLGISKIILTH